HSNKLRPGHSHGNRFRILIRDVVPEAADRIALILDHLRQQGLANFYGPQRFGRDGETVRMGFALLGAPTFSATFSGAPRVTPTASAPRPRSPFLKKLALSAAQSAVFNHYLARRLHDGLLRKVISGDVMAKWPFGGMFVAEDLASEQARLEAREI